MSHDLKELFDSNRRWAEATEARTPGFFTSLLQQQTPQYLWIGCSDSRVPANEIVGLLPGEMFVHRNVDTEVATRSAASVSVGEVSSRTHQQGQSEDHFESASRVFSNP